MAIGFGRMAFIKRSAGKNACAKAAYNSRDKVHFQGTKFQEAQTYSWSHKEPVAYHKILLPEGADPQFSNKEFLWNEVEKKEKRIDSQTAIDFVFALPDDEILSFEDRKEIAEKFIQKHFVDKGLIAQVDIHPPDKKMILDPVTGELEGYDHNWHAHALITTRRLKEDGKSFEDHKATDLLPDIRNGKVLDAERWGQHVASFLTDFFESKGWDLKVDPSAIIPQKHLGPVRLRHPSFNYLKHEEEREKNAIKSQDVKEILKKITEKKSVFNVKDVDDFFAKYVTSNSESLRNKFWEQKAIVQLFDQKTQQPLNHFTTHEIIKEERGILRLADHLHQEKAFQLVKNHSIDHLNIEQSQAFNGITQGKKLSCIEGFAGTGKSHLLKALKDTYEKEGYVVRGFGPDHATVHVLKDKGFDQANTIHYFLFSNHHNTVTIKKNKEVWIVDEAGKIGNRPLAELLKAANKAKAQVIFAGDSAQFSSVDRGGMFKKFSERYGAQPLVDIQRQKEDSHRAMAKNLATGQMSQALNLLVENQGLHWSENALQAREKLLQKWLIDKQAFPEASSLIITHKNQDVKELNQFVRLYRKEKGELGQEDYLCESLHGKILVSTGDLFEFRKKDKTLGVSNGTKGTLIQVSANQFTVKLEESERQVSFDPQEYPFFQLGYASTNYRSQGKTIDRIYVLYSKSMDKIGFYVGLTRHVKQAHLFVSKDTISCLSHLKKQAYRVFDKFTTLDFTTMAEINKQIAKLGLQEQIQTLKESSSLLTKTTGYMLSIWDTCKEKTQNVIQKIQDLKPDYDFYNPETEEVSSIAAKLINIDYHAGRLPSAYEGFYPIQMQLSQVNNHDVETKADFLDFKLESQQRHAQLATALLPSDLTAAFNPALHQTLRSPSSAQLPDPQALSSFDKMVFVSLNQKIYTSLPLIEGETLHSPLSVQDQSFAHQTINQAEARKQTFENLPKDQQQKISSYNQAAQEASQWYTISQVDKDKISLWKKACIERNTQAYDLTQSVKKETLQSLMAPSSLKIVHDQAGKHEAILAQRQAAALAKQENSPEMLEGRLKEQIEPLAYALFPEGPTRKTSKEMRFGSKGSLSLICQGPKAGVFNDFEKGEKGGLLKLIQTRLNCDFKESIKWAKDFLGHTHAPVPTQFHMKKEASEKEMTWVSLKPEADKPAPALEQVAPKLAHFYHETARHAYRNAEGELLFYTLRLTDKNDPTKKSVLPLSYGKPLDSHTQPQWILKAYQTEKKPLYHLDQLQKNPKARVLIVEGEKTADQAIHYIKDKNIVCVTWSGGAAAVNKTDWTPLYGKDIVIWPDNDKAGFDAAKDITSNLRQLGVESLRTVSPEKLSSFPAKWDLADPLPAAISRDMIDTYLLIGFSEVIPLREIKHVLPRHSTEVDLLKAKEILLQVEERLRPALEKQFKSDPNQINKTIINETITILLASESTTKYVAAELNTNETQTKLLSFQAMLYQAEKGQLPSTGTLLEMKKALAEIKTNYSPSKNQDGAVQELAHAKSLSHVLKSPLTKPPSFANMEKIMAKETQIIQQQLAQSQALAQAAQQKQQSRGFDFSL
jgi:Ti-type conjugative transfer relaxase TraA